MDKLHEFMQRHTKVALLFSGGRDSVACLRMCEPWLKDLDVVWFNPGNPYPETVEQMKRLRAEVPRFIEVVGEQPAFIAAHGHPVDMVPLPMTVMGRSLARTAGLNVIPAFSCCAHNIWEPMRGFIKSSGYTGIIRGDKDADALRAPVQSGDVLDGVEFMFPIERWSDEQVSAYCGSDLPASYKRGLRTSLDCINCTGYLMHNVERINDLKTTAPAVHAEVMEVLRRVADAAWRFDHLVATIGA